MIRIAGDAARRLARHPGFGRAKALVGFIIGALLLAGAILFLAREGVRLQEVAQTVRRAPVGWVIAAIMLPIGNWLCMCACFWTLMRDDAALVAPKAPRPLSLAQMGPVLGLTWLFNYLPMRPGLFGRLAYHRVVNAIPIAASVRAVIMNLVAGAAAIALATTAVAIGAIVIKSTSAVWLALAAIPPMLTLAASSAMTGLPRTLLLAVAIRYADLLVWAARYLVVFRLIDESISLPGALAAAAASQAVSIVPFSGNGLGLREWVIGLLVPVLPAALTSASLARQDCLTADLVNRAAELAAVVPVGLISACIIARWLRTIPNARARLSLVSHVENSTP